MTTAAERVLLRRAAEYVVTIPLRRVRARDVAKELEIPVATAIDLLARLERHGVVGHPFGSWPSRDVLVTAVPRSIPRPRSASTTERPTP